MSVIRLGLEGAGRSLFRRAAVSFVSLLLLLGVGVPLSLPPAVGAWTSENGSEVPRNSLLLTDTPTPTPAPACGLNWRVVASPNVGSLTELNAIVDISANDVWAVGRSYNPFVEALTMHWDGSEWSIDPSSRPTSAYSMLEGVAAVSSTDVWAVGRHIPGQGGSVFRAFIEHWNGNQWSVVPGPQPGVGSGLEAVAAVSANDVWAVGTYDVTPGNPRTLILHWNGAEWSVVESPNRDTSWNLLFGVAAVTANDVWAVGASSDGPFTFEQTLILHWNGVEWSIVDSPNPGTLENRLFAVDAISANDVWAVGHYARPAIHFASTLHWDGATWSIVPGPTTPDVNLRGVSARAPNDVWAVGGNFTMHWAGSGWCEVLPPAGGYWTVAAISEAEVWAAGVGSGSGSRIIRYNDPCATPTSTPATSTPQPSNTPAFTATPGNPSSTPTRTPVGATLTPGSTPTVTPCPMSFIDVQQSDYFYEAVRYLYCANVISGYSDGTFRPYNNTTRGQLAKIVVLAFGIPLYSPPRPTFSDVLRGHTFYQFVETAAVGGLVSGYSDGTFRPENDVTRGQLSKVVVVAAGWPFLNPPVPTFSDVAPGSAFYHYVETAYERSIISGYADGTFRPGNSATRGQIGKIVYNGVTAP